MIPSFTTDGKLKYVKKILEYNLRNFIPFLGYFIPMEII